LRLCAPTSIHSTQTVNVKLASVGKLPFTLVCQFLAHTTIPLLASLIVPSVVKPRRSLDYVRVLQGFSISSALASVGGGSTSLLAVGLPCHPTLVAIPCDGFTHSDYTYTFLSTMHTAIIAL
jgi:hypothetical protein